MHPVLKAINMFQTSPAPSSAPHISPGESVPLQAYGVGELAAAESSPAAASIDQSSDGAGERPRLETDVGPGAIRSSSRSVNAEAGVTPGPSEAYPPAGYVLVPIDELKCWRDDLAYYRAKEQRAQLEPLPAFLRAPSASYLDAIERG